EAVTRVLQSEDYLVSSAATSHDAMLRFNEGQIDVVVLDLSLGTEDGWDVFHAFKDRCPELPIIVTSARVDELAHSSANRASAVLEKPFDIPILLDLLKQVSQSPTIRLEVKQERNGARPHPSSKNQKPKEQK